MSCFLLLIQFVVPTSSSNALFRYFQWKIDLSADFGTVIRPASRLACSMGLDSPFPLARSIRSTSRNFPARMIRTKRPLAMKLARNFPAKTMDSPCTSSRTRARQKALSTAKPLVQTLRGGGWKNTMLFGLDSTLPKSYKLFSSSNLPVSIAFSGPAEPI